MFGGFFISATPHVAFSRCDSARPNALSCEAGHYVETYFMSDDIASLRREVREQFTQLTNSTNKMASSVSELTALVARIEERNVSHDDGMKRIGRQIDDHEDRIRTVERNALTQTSYLAGTWKVVTIVAAVVSVAVGVAARFIPV